MSPRRPREAPASPPAQQPPAGAGRGPASLDLIRLTGDRILVRVPGERERRSKGGLLIPATATTPVRRCIWSDVALVGPETRGVRVGDLVLFIPQTGLEVDVDGESYLLLRERDVQAVSSEADEKHRPPGQYL
jgi:chaperonin GroES